MQMQSENVFGARASSGFEDQLAHPVAIIEHSTAWSGFAFQPQIAGRDLAFEGGNAESERRRTLLVSQPSRRCPPNDRRCHPGRIPRRRRLTAREIACGGRLMACLWSS